MKKTIPFMISIIAIASIASTAVLGNTQTAYAGPPPITSCTATMVNEQFVPNESVKIPITITCDSEILDVGGESNDCQLNQVDVMLTAVGPNSFTFDETILNLGDTSEEHCTVVFLLAGGENSKLFVPQEIWINEPAVSCGTKTVLNADNQCIPDLTQVCGQGTFPDFDALMCFGLAMETVGGVLLDINTASLLIASIGTNPVITALVGITLAGVAGQAVWFVHRRRKSENS